ncbi:MAG: prolyl aminopeptidase, partial [Endozoicomonadaceae bacterium]|nr:prolyl aminopeptidase [Endozoicomonadaceae bacterium]
IKMSYAKAWGLWMTRCSTLRLNQKAIDDFQDNRRALTTAKIAIHFSIHDYSMTTQDLFKQIESIRHIPGIFIHGRYDMLSPVSNSFRLAQHWPAAECQIVRDAGHSAIDPAMQDALVLATEVFANRFKNEFNLNHSS